MTDIEKFSNAIISNEPIAIASVPQKNKIDYSMFDGAGGYIVAFLKLHDYFKSN